MEHFIPSLVWKIFCVRIELTGTVYRATDTSPHALLPKKSIELDSRQGGFPNSFYSQRNGEGLFILANNTWCLLPSDKTDATRHLLREEDLLLTHKLTLFIVLPHRLWFFSFSFKIILDLEIFAWRMAEAKRSYKMRFSSSLLPSALSLETVRSTSEMNWKKNAYIYFSARTH